MDGSKAKFCHGLAGKAYLIRYADDFVIGFTDQLDAQRVMEVIKLTGWRSTLACQRQSFEV